MLKLIRNLLGDKKVIYADTNGHLMPIKWQYIEELNNVQQDLGFTIGNKLKKKHIGKRFTEMVVHRNNPSIRHELTRTILFRNQ